MENLEINEGNGVGVNPGNFKPEPLDSVEPDTEFRRQQELLSTIEELSDKEINGLSKECEAGEKNEFSLELAIGDQVILRPDSCFDGDTLPFGWECSDYSIVNINLTQSQSQALVMAMKKGEATITATSVYPEICKGSIKWEVTVKENLDKDEEEEPIPEPLPEEEYAKQTSDAIEAGGDVNIELTQLYVPEKVLIPVAGTKLDMNFGGQKATQLTGQDFIDLTKGVTATLKGGTIVEELPEKDKAEAAIYMAGSSKDTLVLEDMTIKAARCVYLNNAADECVIKSGRYEVLYNSTPAVYVACSTSATNSGKVIIEGGTFGTPGVKNKYLLNLLDKLNKVEGKSARDFIEVKGGTFYNYDPAKSQSENPEADFVAKGYIVGHYQDGEDTIYMVEKYDNHPDMDIDGPNGNVITWEVSDAKVRAGIVEIDADKDDKSKEGETKPDLEL